MARFASWVAFSIFSSFHQTSSESRENKPQKKATFSNSCRNKTVQYVLCICRICMSRNVFRKNSRERKPCKIFNIKFNEPAKASFLVKKSELKHYSKPVECFGKYQIRLSKRYKLEFCFYFLTHFLYGLQAAMKCNLVSSGLIALPLTLRSTMISLIRSIASVVLASSKNKIVSISLFSLLEANSSASSTFFSISA